MGVAEAFRSLTWAVEVFIWTTCKHVRICSRLQCIWVEAKVRPPERRFHLLDDDDEIVNVTAVMGNGWIITAGTHCLIGFTASFIVLGRSVLLTTSQLSVISSRI